MSSSSSSSASSVAIAELGRALKSVLDNISLVVKNKQLTKTPTLVAVSKTKPIEAIHGAYNHGQRHFGENYVQELIEKAPVLPNDIQWHFIGHLQSNKCKVISKIPNLYMVESVDSTKLANELNKACESVGRPTPLNVLIQVNTSNEVSKYGCTPQEASSLFLHVLTKCPLLAPRGLMTIGRLADTPQPDCFETLKKCKEEILQLPEVKKTGLVEDNFDMSMGMSGDYEIAMEYGSSIVRIGSTIFGARDYSNKKHTNEQENKTNAHTEQK